METEYGCGVATHDSNCLCDVIITNPLPPLEDCMTNAVQDMWMGKQMVKMRGYSIPWRDSDILDYLEDMRMFYDAWHESKTITNQDAQTLEEMEVIFEDYSDSPWEKWGDIRTAVHYAMDRFDYGITRVLMHLQISAQTFVDAATTLKGGSGWTTEKLEKLEELLLTPDVTQKQIMDELDISISVVRGLTKYWEEPRNRVDYASRNDIAAQYMHQLCRNTSMTPRQIVDEVKQKHGKEYSRSTITNYRRRANAKIAKKIQ